MRILRTINWACMCALMIVAIGCASKAPRQVKQTDGTAPLGNRDPCAGFAAA